MRNEKTLWFDMDGTIANLYGVDGWLSYLKNEDILPYKKASLLYEKKELIELLQEVKSHGYNIGIISWTSKNGSLDYSNRVKKAKIEWLNENGLLNLFDKILIEDYGVNKSVACQKYGYGVLVDDEKNNLNSWNNGLTIDANENIIKNIKKVLKI